jgi:CubicO group peptidase (beta-lactamase class C family)
MFLAVAALAPAAQAAPQSETLTKDSPRATAGGTTFTAPATWTFTSDGNLRALQSPEKDLTMWLIDSDAADADAAVKAAWQRVQPGFSRPLHIAQDLPPRFGWEKVRSYDYETSPVEHRGLAAQAHKHGKGWTVVLMDGSEAGFERRSGQLGLVFTSLRPAGYNRESFAGKTAHKLDAKRIAELGDFIKKTMAASGVPGVAIGLVQDGKVLFTGGFGRKQLDKPEPVDADTLFIIASNTKALTTLLLAKEVDLGKFTWNSPVTQVYPSFKLGSAEVTKQVLMKHLVCACTGLPRQDLEWIMEFDHATPSSEMKLLGTFTPTSKFGEVFQYSNLMASAAGFIGGWVLDPKSELGAAYDAAMRRELFGPLGMKTTTLDFTRALAGNHAMPHGEDVDGNPAPADNRINYSIVPLRPAGGAWSSANELLKYVTMELAKGKLPDGKQLVSEASLMQRREPQVMLGEDRHYGMGLMIDKHLGVTLVHHGGDMIGFHSDMFWIPEANLGGVILTNGDPGYLIRGSFERRVMELVYDGKVEAEEDALSAIARHKEEIKTERKNLMVPPDPLLLKKLAARYANPVLGEVAFIMHGKEAIADFGEFQSPLASRKNVDGVVSLQTIGPGIEGFVFVPGEKNGKRTLTTRDGQHEYVFVEK